MITVGVREFKQQASKLLRLVREEGKIVEITFRGEAVARLVATNAPALAADDVTAILTSLEQLSAETSAHWPEGLSAVDAVRDVRRKL